MLTALMIHITAAAIINVPMSIHLVLAQVTAIRTSMVWPQGHVNVAVVIRIRLCIFDIVWNFCHITLMVFCI